MRYLHRVAIVLLACLLALSSLLGCNPATGANQTPTLEPTTIANVATLATVATISTSVVPAAPPALPSAALTIELPLPGLTPTKPIPTITPTPAILQAAVMMTPSIVSTIEPGLNVDLHVEKGINSTEPIVSMMWTPDGDGLLYVTTSGKLYWSDLEGSSPTLLHTYEQESALHLLADQVPLGNTMYLVHLGKAEQDKRLPSHVDKLTFTPGQPPRLAESSELPVMWNIHWWKPDRASAVLGIHYLENAFYEGGERLVTVDAQGHVVEEQNIPYMQWSAMRPGGEWLAYTTSQQFTSTPLYNSEPTTGYLMNLISGERLQLTPSEGGGVGGWSPDGKWLFVGAFAQSLLVDPTAKEAIALPRDLRSELSWSPDSRRIAVANLIEISDGHRISGWKGDLRIIDVPSRKMATFDYDTSELKDLGVLSEAKWSPDGSRLALLTRDRDQDWHNSRLNPAIYLVSVK